MIDLRKKGLPDTVLTIDGEPIVINTDFRAWIQFWVDLQNDENEDRKSVV